MDLNFTNIILLKKGPKIPWIFFTEDTMKKLISFLLIISTIFIFSGCSLEQHLSEILSSGDSPVPETSEIQSRVYMDKITGTLHNFTGKKVTIKSDDISYTFNLSEATLECENGMLRGDEISVIYEGKLEDNNTDHVKALKVVDEFHKKTELKNRTVYGAIQNITPNSITLTTEAGNTATYPITATEQYYQNGIVPGSWVYIHFRGNYRKINSETGTIYNAHQVKVQSISDTDPLTVTEIESSDSDKQMKATILDLQMNDLHISIPNHETSFVINLSGIPCYFKGGISAGATVYITYRGDFDGKSLDSISIRAVTGQDPSSLKKAQIHSYLAGEIIGTTANTITIQTSDGIPVTFNKANSTNAATQKMKKGNWIKIIFDPAKSINTNIHTAIRIEDV